MTASAPIEAIRAISRGRALPARKGAIRAVDGHRDEPAAGLRPEEREHDQRDRGEEQEAAEQRARDHEQPGRDHDGGHEDRGQLVRIADPACQPDRLRARADLLRRGRAAEPDERAQDGAGHVGPEQPEHVAALPQRREDDEEQQRRPGSGGSSSPARRSPPRPRGSRRATRLRRRRPRTPPPGEPAGRTGAPTGGAASARSRRAPAAHRRA